MTTFVLVHGACHGAWCWNAVAAELGQRGHQVIAPDLPCDDPEAGLEDYVETVLGSMEGVAEDVVLVGHSLGGLTIPIVASRRPVKAMVFVAGIIGMPGKSLADLAEVDADRDGALGEGELTMFDNGTFVFTEAGAMRALYHDCAEGVASAAISQLRPQRSLWSETSPISAWPAVHIESIVCTEDKIVNRTWAERTARERLGIEPTLMRSGHSPMLSQPNVLAESLIRFASS